MTKGLESIFNLMQLSICVGVNNGNITDQGYVSCNSIGTNFIFLCIHYPYKQNTQLTLDSFFSTRILTAVIRIACNLKHVREFYVLLLLNVTITSPKIVEAPDLRLPTTRLCQFIQKIQDVFGVYNKTLCAV